MAVRSRVILDAALTMVLGTGHIGDMSASREAQHWIAENPAGRGAHSRPSWELADSLPCPPPQSDHKTRSYAQIDALAGAYRIAVVWANEPKSSPRRIAYGHLSLWETDSVHRYFCGGTAMQCATRDWPRSVMLLAGRTDVVFPPVAMESLANDRRSRDPDLPGLQVTDQGDMLVGRSISPNRGPPSDAGIGMSIVRADSLSFEGVWSNWTMQTPRATGWFCARRVASPAR
jgi:hypothetical protein